VIEMLFKETFNLPESVAKSIGEEWAGAYVVHELDAREYIQMQSEATSFMVEEVTRLHGKPVEKGEQVWDGVIPPDVMNKFLVCKSVTHDGKPLDPRGHIPSKLYEILSWKSLPINSLSGEEYNQLFLSSSASAGAKSPHK